MTNQFLEGEDGEKEAVYDFSQYQKLLTRLLLSTLT
jgi:hypothetical protein